MRSCPAIPPADRPRTSCSTSATSSSRPCVCCCRAIRVGSECCPPNGGSQRCSWSSPSSHLRSVRPFFSSRPLNLPAWWWRRPLAQRLSLQLLHFSRHAWRPCRQWRKCEDGEDQEQRWLPPFGGQHSDPTRIARQQQTHGLDEDRCGG